MNSFLSNLKTSKKLFSTSLDDLYVADGSKIKQYREMEGELVLMQEYDAKTTIIALLATIDTIIYSTATSTCLMSVNLQVLKGFPKFNQLKCFNNHLFGTRSQSIYHISIDLLEVCTISENILDFAIYPPFIFILSVDSIIEVNFIVNHTKTLYKYTIFDKITSIAIHEHQLLFVKNNKQHVHRILSPITDLLSKSYLDEAIIYVEQLLNYPFMPLEPLVELITSLMTITMLEEAQTYLLKFPEQYLFLIQYPLAESLLIYFCRLYRISLNLDISKQLCSLFASIPKIEYKHPQLHLLGQLLDGEIKSVSKLNPKLSEYVLPLLGSISLQYQVAKQLNNPNLTIDYALELGYIEEAINIAQTCQIEKTTLQKLLKFVEIKHFIRLLPIITRYDIDLEYPYDQLVLLEQSNYNFTPKIPNIDCEEMINNIHKNSYTILDYGLLNNIEHYIFMKYLINAPIKAIQNFKVNSFYSGFIECRSNFNHYPIFLNQFKEATSLLLIFNYSTLEMSIFLRCILQSDFNYAQTHIIQFLITNYQLIDPKVLVECLPNWKLSQCEELLTLFVKFDVCKEIKLNLLKSKYFHLQQQKQLWLNQHKHDK